MAEQKLSFATGAAARDAAARLQDADAAFLRNYPGEGADRQPVHTVYGGAQLFSADAASKLGRIAQAMLEQYAPGPLHLVDVLGVGASHAERVYERVRERLATQPVEDFRIDFEDGYGHRPDAEEDGHARAAAIEVARGLQDNVLPPYIGIRIKSVTPELRARAIRTLDIFLTTLLDASGGALPPNFVVSLP